jgi:uncharacterized RmlC-like cupin family protein
MTRAEAKRDDRPACFRVSAGEPFVGKQGFTYRPAISAETVGAKGIHMQLLTIPPGGRAKAHKHASHETAIYMISGEATTYYGERLEHSFVGRAGDFIYIGANVPHLPHNHTDQPVVAVVARTDPNEQESIVLLPELDALVP